METKIQRGPKNYEFWAASYGFASGTEQEMKEAKRVWKEVLDGLNSSKQTKQANQMFQQFARAFSTPALYFSNFP